MQKKAFQKLFQGLTRLFFRLLRGRCPWQNASAEPLPFSQTDDWQQSEKRTIFGSAEAFCRIELLTLPTPNPINTSRMVTLCTHFPRCSTDSAHFQVLFLDGRGSPPVTLLHGIRDGALLLQSKVTCPLPCPSSAAHGGHRPLKTLGKMDARRSLSSVKR